MEGFDENGFKRIKEFQKSLTDSELLPFSQILILKDGKEVFYNHVGHQDVETKTPISRNSVSRIYSMTKPISSLALMMLYEKGLFQLTDPVHLYLGDKWKKKNMKVLDFKNSTRKERKYLPCNKTITIQMLLTHTSGISYGFDVVGMKNEVDFLYFEDGLLEMKKGKSFVEKYPKLEDFVDKLAEMSLMFQPGTHYNYGFNVEVVGRLIEVLTGECYGKFVLEKIIYPLKMTHTHFAFTEEDIENDHVTTLYRHQLNPLGKGLKKEDLKLRKIHSPNSRQWTKEQTFFKPGEGLVSTIDDYAKFAQMLHNGGELNGVRIISRKTIEFMASNHLRDENNNPTTIGKMKHPNSFGDVVHGSGFGLGLCIDIDPPGSNKNTSPGTFYWSGAAETHFWVDPVEDVVVLFFSQVLMVESKLLPLRNMVVNVINSCFGGKVDGNRILSNSQCYSKL